MTDVSVWLQVAANNSRASGCGETRKVRRQVHICEKRAQVIEGEMWFQETLFLKLCPVSIGVFSVILGTSLCQQSEQTLENQVPTRHTVLFTVRSHYVLIAAFVCEASFFFH